MPSDTVVAAVPVLLVISDLLEELGWAGLVLLSVIGYLLAYNLLHDPLDDFFTEWRGLISACLTSLIGLAMIGGVGWFVWWLIAG